MVTQLTDHGEKTLAISVGPSARGTALTRLVALKGSPGWLVHGERTEGWQFSGMTERPEGVFLVGPWLDGETLSEVLERPLPQALPYLARLADALVTLSARSVDLFPLQTDGILFTADGGVLFLPPAVLQEVRGLRTFEENRETYEAVNQPDLKRDKLASWTLGVMLYRLVTGRFPFGGTNTEDLHEQARKLRIVSPTDRMPELLPEASELIMAALGRSAGRAAPNLDEWLSKLRGWSDQPPLRQLATEERERIVQEATTRQVVSDRSFQRRMFWEKNWKVAAIVAAVVIVVGVILGSILKNALAPRVTRGFSPLQVVEAFYKSMNSLDQTTMQACVIDGAARGEINEVTTLYVTSRVTLGYEGQSNIISADEWDKAGRPALPSPKVLYGVTGLTVVQEQGEPTPVYQATYDKWSPAQPPDTGKPPSPDEIPKSEGHHVVDRLSLKKDKGDWVIYKIDRLSSDPLPAPQ